ncbi:hypothetical protein F4677DRAFT_459607 [Hypoxylon crocopeplum]|nr:hypothetical protein F4677DRAFT_459607 [Hypoxylon crocopeplum]
MGSEVASKEQHLREVGPWDISDILKLPSAQEIIVRLGEKELRAAFDEYVELHPSPEKIVAEDHTARVFAMVGVPEPTYTNLYKWARDPPTDEPWAEALFAYRVKRHLESRDCEAVDWTYTEYYSLPTTEERRCYREVSLERYRSVLQILERLQEDRHRQVSQENSGTEPLTKDGSRNWGFYSLFR